MRWRFLGLSAAIALIAAIVTVIALTRETDATQRHGSTPPVTTSTTTALTATSIAPETAQVVAIAFVTAWLRRGLTAAAWHSGVAAKSTPELAQALDGVDPKTVPARRITGAAVLVNGTTTSATVTVPVDTGLLTLELAQHNANWLVDAIDWTPN